VKNRCLYVLVQQTSTKNESVITSFQIALSDMQGKQQILLKAKEHDTGVSLAAAHACRYSHLPKTDAGKCLK